MSLYNMLFGISSIVPVALAALQKRPSDFGRFRDAWIEDDKIVIYTRNGGGNRECWRDDEPNCECVGCFMTYRVHKMPHYSHDRDDDFDCTYASIYFDFPPEHAEVLRGLALGDWKPDERWRAALEALGRGERPDIEDSLRPLVEFIHQELGKAEEDTDAQP